MIRWLNKGLRQFGYRVCRCSKPSKQAVKNGQVKAVKGTRRCKYHKHYRRVFKKRKNPTNLTFKVDNKKEACKLQSALNWYARKHGYTPPVTRYRDNTLTVYT